MVRFQVGVDEAGKGPVLGPMVAAAVRVDDGVRSDTDVRGDDGGHAGDDAALPDGLADSKRLSADRRESLAARLRKSETIETAVGVVTTDEIDDPETDMNRLTVTAQVRALVGVLRAGDRVVVDAGDVSESRFARRIEDGLVARGVTPADVTAEHGADDRFPLVSAASIVAKVERDRRIALLADQYTEYGPLGSGYPSDRTTRAFLAEYVATTGELPACARRSWSTCADVLAAFEQSSLDSF